MVKKSDFTDEEWELIKVAPFAAGQEVALSDPTGKVGDVRRAVASLLVIAGDPPPDPLGTMQRVIGDDLRDTDIDNLLPEKDDSDAIDVDLDRLRAALEAVDRVCDPEVAKGYRIWVKNAALATAKAVKRGGHFGIGGADISAKEQEGLDRIDDLLGL